VKPSQIILDTWEIYLLPLPMLIRVRDGVIYHGNLRNEELQNLYSSPNKIRMKSRRMRLAGYVARMESRKMYVCRILVGKPEGKRPLARRRRRWVDNIKMDFR
jgi:hypothetical protein